ncbi:MAG: hypothetical protein QGG25_18440, partial [Phycisphaerae bacterium]|nr:hypothetical protein [Phycisphaerae bacterium]
MRNLICCVVIAVAAGALLAADAKPAEYQKAVRGEKSLISYYTFDAGDAADTVAKNHGKVVGKGAKFDAGVAGKAINFTAKTALVEFGYVPEFAFKDGSGTVEVLLNHSGYKGGTNFVFAQRKGWETNSMRQGICLTKLNEIWVVSRGSTENFAKGKLLLSQNQWHHLAVVYRGGGFVSAYLDGNKLSLNGRAPLVKDADKHTFHLGAPNAKPDWECWSGKFDELAIYADPLDEKTILQHARLAGCIRKLPTDPAAAQAFKSTLNFKDYPLLTAQPIVFVTRRQYSSHYHAIDTLFHTGELNW